jgi:hypothetical protein
MLSAEDADHSRMRKNLSHAFSDRALRDQEVLVQDLVVSGPPEHLLPWRSYPSTHLHPC